MLSRLCSLPLSSLKDIDTQADKIIFRSDPLYNIASIVQSFTQHYLRPHLDKESDHKRHFLKIPFINKGIDFIDLQSIFRDSKVVESVPLYFKNLEPPIICYKYNKPIRSFIFNYNKIVADLNINSTTPTTCECSTSKFCYQPVGHVITGNFEIIKDKRLRNILTKGPKYRLPTDIDFIACRDRIAESLHTFSKSWCRRENADINALHKWIDNIFKIIDTRIKFYSFNCHLLPPRPRVTFRYLRSSLQTLHSQFVFVPADKASNNVIII